MSSKSDFSYLSLIFDDKKVIESTNIKKKALEIVHQKENVLSRDNQLFDFYLNKNQIIIEKLTQKLIYEDFIEDENSDKTFKIICKNARLNPKENFLLILENYQFGNLENIFEDILPIIYKNRKQEFCLNSKYSKNLFSIPSNLYILGVINKRY